MAQDDDLEAAAENVRVLISGELEAQHRLEGHAVPVSACPVCRAHDSSAA
jgi:hypothetical protein